jgi:hypothetical protein
MIPRSQRTADPLNEFDYRVAAIISSRRGAANAIAIGEIIAQMWPEEWFRMSGSARWLRNHEREIKGAVHNLRRAGRAVGSNRGAMKALPKGYFMVETAKELEDTVGPLRRQALNQLVTVGRLLGSDREKLRDLAGQIRLALEPAEGRAGGSPVQEL